MKRTKLVIRYNVKIKCDHNSRVIANNLVDNFKFKKKSQILVLSQHIINIKCSKKCYAIAIFATPRDQDTSASFRTFIAPTFKFENIVLRIIFIYDITQTINTMISDKSAYAIVSLNKNHAEVAEIISRTVGDNIVSRNIRAYIKNNIREYFDFKNDHKL